VPVCFDLDGTLVRYGVPFADVVERALRESGGEPTERSVEAFLAALGDAFEAFACDPYAAAASEVQAVDPEDSAARLADVEVGATERVPGAREALERLADRRRGVLTNGVGGVQRRKLAACGLADAVDALVASQDAGARKPDPRIFAAARERFDLSDADPGPVFVADDLARDLRPAIEAGFGGVLYDPADAVPDPPGEIQRVRTLRAVPDRLTD
jgi:HAD superfamily hydrolase (TIGR01549 family)